MVEIDSILNYSEVKHFKFFVEISVEIHRGGNLLTLSQLEKVYQDWIYQMHDLYDEEIDSGEDQPVIVVGSLDKKKLGISSDGKHMNYGFWICKGLLLHGIEIQLSESFC